MSAPHQFRERAKCVARDSQHASVTDIRVTCIKHPTDREADELTRRDLGPNLETSVSEVMLSCCGPRYESEPETLD